MPKRLPPRRLWFRWRPDFGIVSGPYATKREADARPTYRSGERTVGPFILAERARERS